MAKSPADLGVVKAIGQGPYRVTYDRSKLRQRLAKWLRRARPELEGEDFERELDALVATEEEILTQEG